MQSASVPVCSRAFELLASPPSPTQNAEEVGPVDEVALQSAFGWTQVAETVEKVAGAPPSASVPLAT